MDTLREIEAAVASLAPAQQEALFTFLAARLGRAQTPPSSPNSSPQQHTVMDIPVASLGRVLRPLSPEDDLLGEMLEYRV
jgi:hypothetical protein